MIQEPNNITNFIKQIKNKKFVCAYVDNLLITIDKNINSGCIEFYNIFGIEEEEFYVFIHNLPLQKYNIKTTYKIVKLLGVHLYFRIRKLHQNYIAGYSNDDPDKDNFSNTPTEEIYEGARDFIKFKYKELMKTDHFKIIDIIKLKYNVKPQEELIFNMFGNLYSPHIPRPLF
jgi:hypothetical protein